MPNKKGFWANVNKTKRCWTWTGKRFGTGGRYGAYKGGKYKRPAHRWSWEEANGPIPDGLFVLHKCDNGMCVRPDHLFLGTDADNARDKASKGRCGKLTWDDVELIRQLHARRRPVSRGHGRGAGTRMGATVLAKAFGLHARTVAGILRGENWNRRPSYVVP